MAESRHAAVTGATGLVGSNLVAEMAKAGYGRITVIVRDRRRVANIERTFRFHGLDFGSSPIEVAEVELADTEALAAVLKGVDTVFNCAAVIMTGDLTERQLIDNNVGVARSVAEASIRAGVKKIVHVSSIAVLDTSGGRSKPVTEECVAEVTAADSAYSQSKYLSDLEMERAARAGLEVIRVLPAVIIGEGDWSLDGSSAMIPAIARGLPFYADGVMGYVDVRDVARAMILLGDTPSAAGEAFIICGCNLTFRELLTAGAAAAGKRPPRIRVGRGALMFGYCVIKALSAMRLMKERGIKRDNLDSVLYGNRYDGSKVEKFCNFAYSPPEATIGRVVGNYLAEKGKTNG